MAGRLKHMERSHRSYRQKQANIGNYFSNSMQKQARKQAGNNVKHGGFLSKFFGRNKGDK